VGGRKARRSLTHNLLNNSIIGEYRSMNYGSMEHAGVYEKRLLEEKSKGGE